MGKKIRNWVIRILAVLVVIALGVVGFHTYVKPIPFLSKEKVELAPEKEKEEPSIEIDTDSEEVVSGDTTEHAPKATAFEETGEEAVIEETPVPTIDYGLIAKEGFEKAKKLAPNDREVRKWIIRLNLYSKIQGVQGTDAELLEAAQATLKVRTAFHKVAKEKYSVTLTEEEVATYIKEQVQNSEESKAFAASLEMDVTYFNTVYERDQYEYQLSLKKVMDKSMELNARKDGEADEAYMQRLNTILNEEVGKEIK